MIWYNYYNEHYFYYSRYDSTSYGDSSGPTSASYDSSVPPSAGYDNGVPQSAGYNSVPQSAGYDSIHSNSSGAERVSAYSATDYEIQQMVNGQQVSSVPQGKLLTDQTLCNEHKMEPTKRIKSGSHKYQYEC